MLVVGSPIGASCRYLPYVFYVPNVNLHQLKSVLGGENQLWHYAEPWLSLAARNWVFLLEFDHPLRKYGDASAFT